MKNMKKILVMALAALLLVAVSVAGTVAYLTATTTPVTNTFAPANIDLTLEETKQSDGSALEENEAWKGQFIPGVNLDKDPKVTVTYDVACYVFVKVEETNWDRNVATYAFDGWTELAGSNGTVWYQEFAQPDEKTTEELPVLEDNQIVVSENVNKAALDKLYDVAEDGTKTAKEIKLVFTAYACQKEPFKTALEAWQTGLAQTLPTPDATEPDA